MTMFSYMAWWQPYCIITGLCLISFSVGVLVGGRKEKRSTKRVPA